MTTAILSALPEEQSGLLARLEQGQRLVHAGRVFWRGSLHGHSVVLALSGIGKVAAATTATVLIERFRVARIVFTGVAGGVGEGVAVGDIVVAQDYVQHDMDVSPLFERWRVPGYEGVCLPCDPTLTAILSEAVNVCLVSAGSYFDHEFMDTAPRLHLGLVASGDRFVTCSEVARALRDPLVAAGHDVLAVEMEGAAVAQVCLDYQLPFAAVRTVSDRADASAHVDFPAFMEKVASRYAERIVQQFLEELQKQ
ncbi:5'-methylthioadenosine/adenosylhomocysteine nucleosidase [Simplicispira hankyongi]|uniref:adenosylhomocysteine nucleosidase n=1 Tax=Simplicispira hankyongi TaxID=2315688 RepID=A0A398CBP3_9BURK|nr:5'-methylthioadenosine/adenosylhomocysteine nucleosidase [Simplicispira hankyongi]RID97750.1 5'-methylthioadenosine/adenosylhomocysteine nucleosidase [Simplicispira hankyongi]